MLCLSCGKAEDAKDPAAPTDKASADYAETVERFARFVDDSGFVVSLKDGEPHHQGDSLIWSGVALAALPCDASRSIINGLTAMVDELGGGLYRHPTLSDRVSLDGAIGFYFGVADYLSRCNDSASWLPALTQIARYAAVDDTGINPNSDAKLVPQFNMVRDAVLSMVGARGRPGWQRLLVLESEVIGWAQAVLTGKVSCFRAHVGWLALRTMELADYDISPAGKTVFCRIARDLDLPVVEHWCGRDGLLEYLEGFQMNEWEYRHQRCPAWEAPDGKPGLETPALDRLLALRMAYEL